MQKQQYGRLSHCSIEHDFDIEIHSFILVLSSPLSD